MKKILFSLIITLLTLSASAKDKAWLFTYFKGNGEDGLHIAYSRDGYIFTALNDDRSFLQPVVGVSKLMRDPCLIRTPDGTFHMVWTAGWTEKGIGYASSTDLISWSEQKYFPVMENEPEARNCWAPEIVYDPVEKQFLIFWATTIPGRFPDTEKAGDGGYNHRMYSTTTRDFKSFSKTKLFYENGFNVIDATINKTGRSYTMFLKDETRNPAQKNIKVATSKSLYGPYSEASEPITGKYWAEGPTAARINGTWIVYFDKYTEHKMGAVASRDLKKWEDISDKVSFPEGMRHGTIIEINEEILNRLLNARTPEKPQPEPARSPMTFFNVRDFGARAEQARLEVPEKENAYPDPQEFGKIPAYGFFIRHAKNIMVTDIELKLENSDARPPFIIEDVKGITFNNVRASHGNGIPTFVLKNVTDFRTINCGDVPDKKLARDGNLSL